ncbi:MAG TPA: DUF1800 domain-containing protein [Rhizobacter sp.]|nr:DUF1800 domain-containing protein [Rhizobacter sp.]
MNQQRQTKNRVWAERLMRSAGAAVLVAVLAACGSGGSDDASSGESSGPPPTQAEAARFLAQATYGPTEASINALTQSSYSAWLNDQFTRPAVPHRTYVDQKAADLAANGGTVSPTNFRESYWRQALTGPDQLRQRAAFALSQIFVISFVDGTLANQTRGVTSYYDMLAEKAFGNYRDLLESVSLHPMMGVYLTSLRNQKEDANGRVPDENYAREIMQLFSIGLYELNDDGTTRGSTPTETYTHDDIMGLAKVFTGFSWYAGPNASDRTTTRFFGGNAQAERDFRPMQAYNTYHSISEKRFLGTTIAANGTANADADLQTALDTLFNHHNVGPFIGKQLIQRMVTSNPSPAYVARVAAAFNNNGSGVRGDMKAVFRAILLDPEARADNSASTTFGKVREPVLRLSHLLRAFKATSTSNEFTGIDNTDGTLSQTAMRSPTVFNFYRPGYTPPNSAAAAAGLVAPELQLASEVSVAAYLNYLRGTWLTVNTARDIQLDFSAEMALADNPAALVDRLNLLLMSGQMTSALRTQILAGINGRTIPAPTSNNQATVDSAKRDRVFIGILLTMASPDYMVQK